MSFYSSWINRPVTAGMVLAVFVALSLVTLLDMRIGPSADQGRVTYAVIINYYGVDANRIERDITKPLENAISTIPGIEDINAVSEYGKSRVTVTISSKADSNEVYLLLRDAVDRVYNQLPSAVQKPIIFSSSLDKRPVFIVSFKSSTMEKSKLNQLVEKEIKASFERIEGTGEIEVGGGEIQEIHVQVEPERAAQAGFSISDIATQINNENVLMPVGTMRSSLSTIPLVIKGKFTTIEQLQEFLINVPNSGPQKLGTIAKLGYGVREKESLSRVNGEEQAIIYVESSGSANLVSLCRLLREETLRWEQQGLVPEIILDKGKKIETSISQVFYAIIAGMLIVIILLAVSSGHLRQILILSLMLPFICLFTIGILSLLKISIDTFVLAGLAVGIGNIVDGGIVLTEACKSRRMLKRSAHTLLSLHEVIPPLLSSVLTTVIVLIPLFFLSDIAEGIKSVTISVGLMMLTSLFFTILFIPPFFLFKHKERKVAKAKKNKFRFLPARRLYRFFYRMTLPSFKKPRSFLLAFAAFFAVSLIILIMIGKDLSGIQEEGTLFVHIEYESGDSVETCDERTAMLADLVKKTTGVERIETNARFGNAEMVVRYNAALIARDKLINLIKNEGRRIPSSFIYIPESLNPLGKKIEVAILGDNNKILREFATKSAQQLGKEPWIEQVVLHFKDGPPTYVFSIDHEKCAHSGITTSTVADGMRWTLHGPVALKWIENNREIDLRVMSVRENVGSLEAIRGTVFNLPQGGYVTLQQLGNFSVQREESKIYRKNRQHAVFFTVHTRNLDLDQAIQKLWQALSLIPLPQGYAFELEKSAVKLSEHFKLIWFVLGLALLLIYMILASQSESILCPLLIAITVPLSLTFPVIVLFILGQPLSTPILIGLIILAGMAVNNAILITDRVRDNVLKTGSDFSSQKIRGPILFALRKRIRDLLLTSGTSVLGTLPLLVLQTKGEGMLSSLAFIIFWGILGSLVVTLFFLPAFIFLFPRMLKSYSSG